ncbi:MAG: SH3 domain-containing protein [bacterium]
MSHSRILFVFLSLMLFFFTTGCQKQSEQKVEALPPEPVAQEQPAVCIWDGASVRAQPSRAARMLSSLSLGETLTFLGHSTVDSTDKNREYYKIRLSDGKEGWTSSYLVVVDARAAAVVKKSYLYKRPDLLTVTDETFEPMNMVAVVSEQSDWLEVIGEKRKKKGWIKNRDLSFKDIDVAVAILAVKAMRVNDDAKQKEQLSAIVENPVFSESVFIEELQQRLHPEGVMNTQPEDSTRTY